MRGLNPTELVLSKKGRGRPPKQNFQEPKKQQYVNKLDMLMNLNSNNDMINKLLDSKIQGHDLVKDP